MSFLSKKINKVLWFEAIFVLNLINKEIQNSECSANQGWNNWVFFEQ